MQKLFDNTEVAFALKSNSELDRALYLFKLIQQEPLVKIGSAVAKFALKTQLPVEGVIRATVFDHFCGGVTAEDCLTKIDKMYTKKVHSVLDYSAEGKEDEAQFDLVMDKILRILNFARDKKSIPFAVFKPTGFGRLEIYKKITEDVVLSLQEALEWQRIKERYKKVGKAAYEAGIPLLIDAEESWMQDAADELIEGLMQEFNKEEVIIFGTLQSYRKDRMEYLLDLHKRAKKQGFKVGMKLVRGAYMEKERERASRKGYRDPICNTKADTDIMFDSILTYMIENIDDMAIFSGTHNEDSCYLLIQLMNTLKMKKNDSRIWFGQLYGMSDHISYNLSKEGYNVAKYLPFGPVRDVMPYLIRRAEENTSVAGQTSRELRLLKTERKRRGV
jgi:proline dehydrogenase